ALDLRREDLGFARGHQPALDALEQLEAQLRLGVRQQLAGGRLRDVQRGGGLGERAGAADRFEDFYMAQAHGGNGSGGQSAFYCDNGRQSGPAGAAPPTETTMHIRQWTAALCAALLCGPAAGQVAAPAHENLNPEAASGYQAKQAVSARHFMVATANPLATQAGYRILKAGGSAADAAIAAQLVLGLTEPQSSGIGGGGFMVHYAAGPRQVRVYDSRETAPAAARPDRFMRDGKPLPFRQAVDSGLSVGTPGLLRGLELAHRQQGRLPWRTLFQPAIELATQGFEVSPRLHAMVAESREALAAQPAAARYFLAPDGQPWPVGHVLKNLEYAEVLRRVADKGAAAFYHGDIAHDIVAAVRAHATPGDLSVADLAGYKARVREPVCGDYRGYRLCGAPPPSSGPLAVLQILGVLE